MVIWMICPYGPVPGEGWREFRFALMGRALAARGHTVVWWTASFAHHFKRQRYENSVTKEVCPGFSIRFIRTTGYRRHVGLARLWFETVFASKLYAEGRGDQSPDVIVSGDTTMAASQVAISLAKRHHAKLVVDVIDLWPELFATVLPKRLCKYESGLFAFFYWLRSRTFANADGITAVSQSYLERALQSAPQIEANRALVAYIGVDVASVRREALLKGFESGLPIKKENEVYVIYAGTLGNNYDIDTLLHACTLLQQKAEYVKVIIAGSGPRTSEIEQYIRQAQPKNLIFLGAILPESLSQVYRACDIALCLYSEMSTVAIPVKVFDYLAAGLPIINSLTGELAAILSRDHTGISYKAGDSLSLTKAIEELAGDGCQREQMSRRCREAALQYDSRLQYEKIAEFVEALRYDCEQTPRIGAA